MEEYKRVTYCHLKKGQKIHGVEEEGCYSSFIGYVKEANAAFVVVEMWNPGGKEERLNSRAWFLIPMTDEEIRQKYNAKAGEVVKNIQQTLTSDEIGYHEMYNAWLSSCPWELAQKCVQKKLTILGHCRDIIPKTAMFTGEKLDVGVCVEDEDGDKFWCHFKSEYIQVLKRKYNSYQKWLKEKNGDVEEILLKATFDVEENQTEG